MYYKNRIISGKVTKVDTDKGLYVELWSGDTGFVPAVQVGDIDPQEWKEYFFKYSGYKFKVLNDVKTDDYDFLLSYKLCNPHVIKEKTKIIPTSKHFSTLKTLIQRDLNSSQAYKESKALSEQNKNR